MATEKPEEVLFRLGHAEPIANVLPGSRIIALLFLRKEGTAALTDPVPHSEAMPTEFMGRVACVHYGKDGPYLMLYPVGYDRGIDPPMRISARQQAPLLGDVGFKVFVIGSPGDVRAESPLDCIPSQRIGS